MMNRKSVEVPIDLIITNPNQPRKHFSKEELEELANSIKKYGILQPIIVNKDSNGKYLLIAGERRLRACTEAGLTKIPAVVKDFDTKNAAVISIVENVQRENLTYMEEAYAYKSIIDSFGITQEQLAERVGKKQSTISNKMRLIALPMEIQEKLIKYNLSERHARALIKLKDEQLINKAINKIVKNNLNVAQTDQLISRLLHEDELDRRKKRTSRYISYQIYLNTIHKAFAQIKDIEKNARLSEEDLGEYMEVKIIIPKKKRCFT